MKKISLAAAAILSLGLLAASPASAGTVASSGAALLGAPVAQAGAQNVYWRRVCRRVWVWRHGHRVRVSRCHRVWVGPRRCGPGWGRPCW